MKLENRIRKIATSKIQVQITRRSRSRFGFIVRQPDGSLRMFPSKAIALQFLLARLRCYEPISFKLYTATSSDEPPF